MTLDKTRSVSQADLEAVRSAAGSEVEPRTRRQESTSPDNFDPHAILQHWSPEQRETYWQPALKMDTRVMAPGSARRVSSRRGSRTALLVSGILIVALLIAIGLLIAIQLLEPADEADQTLNMLLWRGLS